MGRQDRPESPGEGAVGSPGSGAVPACPSLPDASDLQIVAQKKVTRPLLLKFGRNAGKSSITVRPGRTRHSLQALLLWLPGVFWGEDGQQRAVQGGSAGAGSYTAPGVHRRLLSGPAGWGQPAWGLGSPTVGSGPTWPSLEPGRPPAR